MYEIHITRWREPLKGNMYQRELKIPRELEFEAREKLRNIISKLRAAYGKELIVINTNSGVSQSPKRWGEKWVSVEWITVPLAEQLEPEGWL